MTSEAEVGPEGQVAKFRRHMRLPQERPSFHHGRKNTPPRRDFPRVLTSSGGTPGSQRSQGRALFPDRALGSHILHQLQRTGVRKCPYDNASSGFLLRSVTS